jgi:hypothetical protein
MYCLAIAELARAVTKKLSVAVQVASLGCLLSLSGQAAADVIYSANDAFVQSELAGGSPTFGPFSVGHHDEAAVGGFTAFAVGQHTTNFYNPAIHGFRQQNGYQIPAAVVNTNTVSSVVTSYGAILDPSQILLHPGGLGLQGDELPFHNAILRFTAPTTGEYRIQGDWEALAPFKPDHTVNSILINGASVFSSALNVSAFDLTENLSAGDFVDFVVNDNGDIYNDSTGLRATLTASSAAVPEPSTFGLLAIVGVVAGVGMRRRRSVHVESSTSNVSERSLVALLQDSRIVLAVIGCLLFGNRANADAILAFNSNDS